MKSKNSRQKIFVDMLAITVPVDSEYKLKLIDRLNAPSLCVDFNRQVLSYTGGRYNNNYLFTINDQKVKISAYPINTRHNFFRIECNPSKLGKDGRKQLRFLLKKILGKNTIETISSTATVTRLDLTYDLYDMPGNAYIYKTIVKRSEIHREPMNGVIQSQILGSCESRVRTTLYDKLFERNLQYVSIGRNLFSSWQRLETRIRDLDCSLDQLSDDLVVELRKVRFYGDLFLKDHRFDAGFISNAYQDGLNDAFYALRDDNTRKRYRRYLEDYRIYPIDFDNAEAEFDKAIRVALWSVLNKRYWSDEMSLKFA